MIEEPKIRDFYDWCVNPLEALFKWQFLYVGPITPYEYFQHSEKHPGFYDAGETHFTLSGKFDNIAGCTPAPDSPQDTTIGRVARTVPEVEFALRAKRSATFENLHLMELSIGALPCCGSPMPPEVQLEATNKFLFPLPNCLLLLPIPCRQQGRIRCGRCKSPRQFEFQVPIQLGRGWPVDVCPSSVQSKCRYCLSSDVLSETDRENQGLGNSIPHEMTSEICPLGGKPAIRWANRAIDESPSRVCPFRRWRNCNQK